MPQDGQNIIIYNSVDGRAKVSLLARDGNVWLSQQQLSDLFGTSLQNINIHIRNILKEGELIEDSVIKYYLTTAQDGKEYRVKFYSLEMIIAVGYRVRSVRGTQFRQWATLHLSEYLVKGFIIDDERLKKPLGRFDYFDELLNRIRDIRASEMRFYQKVRDLLKLSSDYQKEDKATQMFFAEIQNKLIYAVTQMTAADLIMARADASKLNMGLFHWEGAIVRKADIIVAKNYLTSNEIDRLNRLVTIFLETAELRVQERKDLTLAYWRETVDKLLQFQNFPVLSGRGLHSSSEMQEYVSHIYKEYDARRKRIDAEEADAEDLRLLEEASKSILNRTKNTTQEE